MTWNEFFDSHQMIDGVVPLYKAGNSGNLFVCLHGAGHSAMSFAVLAEKVKSDCILYAFDFRGHGTHFCENETDLSESTLIADTLKVLNYVHQMNPNAAINLVGHSMGGSIATKTALKIQTEMKDSILSQALLTLFIIDVVEGTAMEALPYME
jgi:protein phosphatase methylesterase 1